MDFNGLSGVPALALSPVVVTWYSAAVSEIPSSRLAIERVVFMFRP
jgi:hypothetical protein